MIPRRGAPRGGRRDRTRLSGPGASRAARSPLAEGWRARRRPPSASPSPLPLEALDRLLQRVAFRRGLERLLPDALGLVAPAHHPQHFAEVRADLGIGPPAVGPAQLLRCALQIALAVDRKSTRLNSSHSSISYAVFCLKKKKKMPALYACRKNTDG